MESRALHRDFSFKEMKEKVRAPKVSWGSGRMSIADFRQAGLPAKATVRSVQDKGQDDQNHQETASQGADAL